MKKFLFCVFCIVSILVSVSICSCSKERSTANNVMDETSLLADSGLYSALSGNLCSFLDEVVRSGEVDNDEVLHAIACEKVDEIKPLFAQTKSSPELDSFLNSNWELNKSQYLAMSLLSGIIITENFDFEASAQSCEEIISNLPEVDRAPVLLFYYTVKGVYEYIYPLQTKPGDPIDTWLGISANILGDIFGSALGALIANEAIGIVVASGAAIILGEGIYMAFECARDHVLIGGIVVSNNGFPISGALIQVAGAAISARSDDNGVFSVRVPEGSTIVVSAEGYEPRAIEISEIGSSRFALTPKPGYGGGECN